MIDQLNEKQYRLLRRLANSRVKVYCMPSGIGSDKRENDINLEFNSTLHLCELGLLRDGSDWPKYQELVKRYSEEGRDVVIVILNGIGQEMFGRTPWEKWVN